MAKEIAIGKRAKISEAQQYMILSVLGAAIILGAAISLTMHFIKKISFNADVISAEDKSIVAYSDAIKSTGVCRAPSGSVYTEDELKKCDPESIETSEISGTLRANILENLAANQALNSVPKEDNDDCTDPITGKVYTYEEMSTIYNNAKGAELSAASQLIKSCSALRVIPDALPAFKNEEALMASLNKIFNISGWEPESLNPNSGETSSDSTEILHPLSLNLSIEADSATTTNVLNNVERSIREFDIENATIEWGGDSKLILQAQATAYYIDESSIVETTTTLKGEGAK